MIELPHLVVSVSIVNAGCMLMVNEIDNGINCWNQPAGHVEPGESIEQAAIRECLEESGYRVELKGINGIYQGVHETTRLHFVRISFVADRFEKLTNQLDPEIIGTDWLPLDDLINNKYQLRSEMTRACLEDYNTAPIYPLNFIHSVSHFHAQK